MSQHFWPNFRQKKVSKIGTKVSRFQTLSKIGTVGEWDTTELSEIQTSSDFSLDVQLVTKTERSVWQTELNCVRFV